MLLGEGRDLKIVTQSDIVRFLNERKDLIKSEVLETPIGQLNIPKNLIHASHRTPAIKGK